MSTTLAAPARMAALAAPLRALVVRTLASESRKAGEVGIRITDDAELRSLNRRWRGIDRATDVISFAYDEDEPDAAVLPVGGDLVLSMDRVLAQAKRFRVTPGAELARLVIHGVLHLAGHDHVRPGERRLMRTREEALLAGAGAIVRRLDRVLAPKAKRTR